MATNDKDNTATEVPATEVPTQETVAQETTVEPAVEASVESSVNETAQDHTLLNQRMQRIEKARACFKKYALGAIAAGFVPVPLADMAALTAIQLKMVHSIAAIYDVPFSQNRTKSILGSVLGGSISVTLALPVASFIKLFPVIGQASGVISTSAIGAATTYAIGKVFAQHFESGGTFLDFDEEKARAHFKELYEEGQAFVSTQQSTAA